MNIKLKAREEAEKVYPLIQNNREIEFNERQSLRQEGFEIGYTAEKWVSVEDELPKEYGKYLVYRKGSDKMEFKTWNGTGWAYENNTITHWHPLPNKPTN